MSMSMEKPQRRFKVLLADNTHAPFAHLKTSSDSVAVHPFGDRIHSLLNAPFEPPKLTSLHRSPPVTTESYVWVETKDELELLAEALSQESEFGVDTEQHSLCSFLGFTGLLQISTERVDYLVDTIALHDEMSILREIFADPKVCKVFHGADNDIMWLQRDFHIYVVNLFDTARACDVLEKPYRSLAYLLETYCGITKNKRLQRADWRLRPLPEEMILYARTDAHYLLFIADCLRRELQQGLSGGGKCLQKLHNGNLGEEVSKEFLYNECLRRSNTLCLQLYQKEGSSSSVEAITASLLSKYYSNQRIFNEHGRPKMKSMRNTIFGRSVHSLCAWRDAIARDEDESPRYVLSDHAILALAIDMPDNQEALCQTIKTADEAFEHIEAVAYMAFPSSPSPIVEHHIDFLCDLMRTIKLESKDSGGNFNDHFKSSAKPICGRGQDLSLSHESSDFFSKLSIQGNNDKNIEGLKDIDREIPRNWRHADPEALRVKFVKKFACKAPVYHNCKIFAGDMRLLCFCDQKKLEWYVQRGLAEYVADEGQPAIRLLFEPKGRPEDENNEYYIQSKKNRCVVCGDSSHYLRYRVIPSCYRQHFPEHLKSHRSHDIVLLCVDCHEIAHRAAEMEKKQVAADFGIPLYARKVLHSGDAPEVLMEWTQSGVSPYQLSNAGKALLRHSSTMPPARRQSLEEVIQTYFGRKDITHEDIELAALLGKGTRELRRWKRKNSLAPNLSEDMEEGIIDGGDNNGSTHADDESFEQVFQRAESDIEEEDNVACTDNVEGNEQIAMSNDKHKRNSMSLLGHGPHGKKIVEKILLEEGEEGILQFCQRWRSIFVQALKPDYLPAGWDIFHSGRREFGDYSVYNPSKKEE